MSFRKKIANGLVLMSPLLLFYVLLIPYSWVNKSFIVDWLGCGCPKIDEFGNVVSPDFNANDFTALFWLFVTLCVTVAAFFLSKRIHRRLMWLRFLYVAAIFGVSLWITNSFYYLMQWN